MSFKNLKESFNLFKKNLILILPDAISLLIIYSLLAVVYFYTGASEIMPLVQSAEDASLELMKNFFSENMTQIIISSLLFIIITFFVGVGITAIKFDMITDLMHNKKASLKNSFVKCKPFFWPIVLLRAGIFLIFGIGLLLTLILGGLVYLIFSNWGPDSATMISLAVMIGIGLVLFILLKFGLLFVYQMMFLKSNKHPIKLLRESFKLIKNKTSFVLFSGLMVFALSLIVSGVSNIFSQIIELIPNVYPTYIWSILQIFISISVSIIASIYLFLQLQLKLKKD
ncbi:hypothetical protein J4467_01435 [Candidatus Woesearchaeota archaeon]|nr:hypothetical protein [Candidatus Woesearchaeota archaeon]